eukprot:TRINITY_DN10985_c0_g1_i3.p1 TRINITY_DN10985_c0_g1~~TRINITY_DN10985_c0_g1_i3.p1  ORF type:complete len:252 (-),score=80.80 TRINITY_DN10985_c0_g1_i3:95-778(-)
MTPEIEESSQALTNGKVPQRWMYDELGMEWSWVASSSTLWFNEFNYRHNQLSNWARNEKLGSYWLGGMFNPKGFLHAVKQEDYRRKKAEVASLDRHEINIEVLSQIWNDIEKHDYRVAVNKQKPADKDTVLIHGMYIEGATYTPTKGLDDCKVEILTQLQIAKITVEVKSDEVKPTQAKFYYCPVYRYASRGDNNLITKIKLKSEGRDAEYWKKKGVAVLCSKEYLH